MIINGITIFFLKNALSKSRIERRTPLIDNAHKKIIVSQIAVAISRLFNAFIMLIFIYGQPANGLRFTFAAKRSGTRCKRVLGGSVVMRLIILMRLFFLVASS